MKIRKGDIVKVLSGKDRGKEGKVKLVLPKVNKVVVAGVNVMKRHSKPQNVQGKKEKGIIDFEAPIPVSKVMLIDPKTKKSVRVGFKIENDKKVRISKKSGNAIE